MKVIRARNVHQALPIALDYLFQYGEPRDTRNGPVLQAPGPVTTVYDRPRERVLFWPERNANPFFHFMESMWMLAGRNDVAFPALFVKRMKDFSDDGETFHGAYGYRWRKKFRPSSFGPDRDQLGQIAQALRDNPHCRRQVLSMWDPYEDLGRGGKDLPCNTHAYFQVRDSALDMMVCNRSNDIIWGCYGANAVHFSFLQEYLAQRIGVLVGTYTHVSFNWHGYLPTIQPLEHLADEVDAAIHRDPEGPLGITDPYAAGLEPGPLLYDTEDWDTEVRAFVQWAVETPAEYASSFLRLTSPFLIHVANPLLHAFWAHKRRDYPEALRAIDQCHANDWRIAGRNWLERREAEWKQPR